MARWVAVAWSAVLVAAARRYLATLGKRER